MLSQRRTRQAEMKGKRMDEWVHVRFVVVKRRRGRERKDNLLARATHSHIQQYEMLAEKVGVNHR